jgi:hypothetical protein
MKIGIIIPAVDERWGEAAASAVRAAELVAAEPFVVVVRDGSSLPGGHTHSGDVLSLPRCAADAGATPRAIGATYALGQGCDAIAFLDADNLLTPEHFENAVALAAQGHEVVTSLRWMVSAVTGERMFVDRGDSDGLNFADTNTIVLFGRAAKFATTWSWFAQPSGTDRIFWDRVRHSFLGRIACTQAPTVEYVTRWAAHYNHTDESGAPRWQPPNPAKFVVANAQGERDALIAEPVWGPVVKRWAPKGMREVKP